LPDEACGGVHSTGHPHSTELQPAANGGASFASVAFAAAACSFCLPVSTSFSPPISLLVLSSSLTLIEPSEATYSSTAAAVHHRCSQGQLSVA
jgi:hypothetical protein